MQKEQFGTNFVKTCVGFKIAHLSVRPHGSEITIQEHLTLTRGASRSIAGQTCRVCVCVCVVCYGDSVQDITLKMFIAIFTSRLHTSSAASWS